MKYGPAALIEARGVGAAEQIERRHLALGDVRVERIGRRREVIGVVAALLVQIDGHVRPVLARQRDAAARFRLRLREPVAVHVEQVVVRAAARPRLVVLGVVRRRIRARGAALQVLEDEPRAAVRVLHRIDQHERLAQHRVDVGIALRRQQVIGLEQRRIGRRDLVAVHAVRQPRHDRQLLDEPLGVAAATAPRGSASRCRSRLT